MQEAKHTPGPWAYEKSQEPGGFHERYYRVMSSSIEGVGKKIIARVGHTVNELDPADARLIAAAPELLDALQGLITHLGPDGYIPNAGAPATAKARAAIAKATASEGAV